MSISGQSIENMKISTTLPRKKHEVCSFYRNKRLHGNIYCLLVKLEYQRITLYYMESAYCDIISRTRELVEMEIRELLNEFEYPGDKLPVSSVTYTFVNVRNFRFSPLEPMFAAEHVYVLCISDISFNYKRNKIYFRNRIKANYNFLKNFEYVIHYLLWVYYLEDLVQKTFDAVAFFFLKDTNIKLLTKSRLRLVLRLF
uniref:Uncharacterized protein n=2 Tax=Heterorhabditis bacteriophora TaxID=37862 RepID=A0A1I7WKK7_HETBA